ncbi:MAG: hypothetical protein IPN40_12395 [Uliginosibacterium sp.]|nr:hypothetical protein [Uliginosibacterium sp.]
MNSLSNLEKSICLLFVAIFILWGGLSILMQEAFLIGRVSDRYVIGASAIRFGWFVLIGAIVFLNELMKFVRMRKLVISMLTALWVVVLGLLFILLN